MGTSDRTGSIHSSLRRLLGLGLTASDSAKPQTITRTLKLKIHTLAAPQLAAPLNRHFNAFDQFRQKVLAELESWWDKDPDAFTHMVRSSGKAKYEEKTSCYAWLYTHFLKGVELPPELSRDAANAMLDNLAGSLKSYLTRRTNVTVVIGQRYVRNREEWEGELATIAKEKNLQLPDAPPSVDSQIQLRNLGLVANEDYVAWGAVEREPGQWNWKQHDAVEQGAGASGREQGGGKIVAQNGVVGVGGESFAHLFNREAAAFGRTQRRRFDQARRFARHAGRSLAQLLESFEVGLSFGGAPKFVVVAPAQYDALATGLTVAAGFTVIVNVFVGPTHEVPPFVNVGVTIIVATIGVVPPFVAVNEEILPDPLAGRPILGWELVHVYVVIPNKLLVVKFTAAVLAVLHTT